MHALFVSAVFIAAVVASPAEHRARNNGNSNERLCSSVNKIVTSYRQQAVATKFCKSYLGITQSTITETSTDSNLPPMTTTSTSYIPCQSPIGARKRWIEAIEDDQADIQAPKDGKRDVEELEKRTEPKPSCYKSFTKPAQISTVCSCLSIPTTPATVTETVGPAETEVVTAPQAPAKFGIMGINFAQMHCLRVNVNAPYGAFEADGQPLTPSTFSLDSQGRLSTMDGPGGSLVYAAQSTNTSQPAVLFYPKNQAGTVPVTCNLIQDYDNSCELVCSGNSGNVPSTCLQPEDAPENVHNPYCLANEQRNGYLMPKVNPR